MRPLSTVENEGLNDLLAYITDEICGVELALPKRTEVRSDVVRLAANLRAKMLAELNDVCEYYALTTDVWTDRRMRGTMASRRTALTRTSTRT
jgi:hypothetical protein